MEQTAAASTTSRRLEELRDAVDANRDQTGVRRPLNDYVATVIGMVRDGRAFNCCSRGHPLHRVAGLRRVSPVLVLSNAHYEALEATGREPEVRRLVRTTRPRARASRPRRPPASPRRAPPRRRSSWRATQPAPCAALARCVTTVPSTSRAACRTRAGRRTAIPARRESQPRRRLTASGVPEQLRRLPRGHGPARTCLRLLRTTTRPRGAWSSTPGKCGPKVLATTTRLSARLRHARRPLDNYWRSGRNALLGWTARCRGTWQRSRSSMGVELVQAAERFARCPGREGVSGERVLPAARAMPRTSRRACRP